MTWIELFLSAVLGMLGIGGLGSGLYDAITYYNPMDVVVRIVLGVLFLWAAKHFFVAWRQTRTN